MLVWSPLLTHCDGVSEELDDSDLDAADGTDVCKDETGAPATPNDGQKNWVFNPKSGSKEEKNWQELNQAIESQAPKFPAGQQNCLKRVSRAVGSQESGGDTDQVRKDQETNGKKGTPKEEVGDYRNNVAELKRLGASDADIAKIRSGDKEAATYWNMKMASDSKYPNASEYAKHNSGGSNPNHPLDEEYTKVIGGHITAQDQCFQQTGSYCRANTKQPPH
jgi:hypothetical protein